MFWQFVVPVMSNLAFSLLDVTINVLAICCAGNKQFGFFIALRHNQHFDDLLSNFGNEQFGSFIT